VLAERTVTNKKTGAVITGTRLYISSIEPASASRASLGRLVRGHWTVENNIHWLRDAVGREDQCRLRHANAACALALLRTALLAPVRAAGHHSLTQLHEACARDKREAVSLIAYQRLA
jgi:predicted transposase YbfD/YdcC